MNDLLLKDYDPHSTIVVERHLVERPRYPAVDAHNHLGVRTDAFGYDSGVWVRKPRSARSSR
jgi:hypothetical protein